MHTPLEAFTLYITSSARPPMAEMTGWLPCGLSVFPEPSGYAQSQHKDSVSQPRGTHFYMETEVMNYWLPSCLLTEGTLQLHPCHADGSHAPSRAGYHTKRTLKLGHFFKNQRLLLAAQRQERDLPLFTQSLLESLNVTVGLISLSPTKTSSPSPTIFLYHV